MNSKTEKCSNMEKSVKGLFSFASEEEKLEFEAEQLHLSIMFKVKELMDDRKWTKSDLAKALGVGKPHITKLFSAEKFINIKMMAKIEEVFDINFNINVFSKHALNGYTDENLINMSDYPKYSTSEIKVEKPYNPLAEKIK